MLCLSGFELYSRWVPPLKLPNCALKQQPHILQLSEALSSVFCLFEEQEQAFVRVLSLPLILIFQNSLYGKRTDGLFSLASHARRACEARALRVRESLTLLLDPVYVEWGTPV